MILFAYDGSVHSDHAITVAGTLLGGGRACVVHAWDALAEASAIALPGFMPDDDGEARAREVAEGGAALARLEGFEAEAEPVRCYGKPARALEEAARRLAPDLVVLGSRGLRGLQAVMKNSVSRRLGTHILAPVLIIPSAHLARR
jgi:nucleotide-binding universal stress UspA family protein